jgi:hypothetical protein
MYKTYQMLNNRQKKEIEYKFSVDKEFHIETEEYFYEIAQNGGILCRKKLIDEEEALELLNNVSEEDISKAFELYKSYRSKRN